MSARLLRQICSVLIVTAYLGATLIAAVQSAAAASYEMSGRMTMQSGDDGQAMPMPCQKKMKAGCVTEAGCMLVVTVLASHPCLATRVGFTAVTYVAAAEFLDGHPIKPPLDPPISRI